MTEDRNVNRILNSTMQDAAKQRPKVDVVGDAIERTGPRSFRSLQLLGAK